MTRTRPRFFESVEFPGRLRSLRDCTVSGRACTMNSSPVWPSLAHSMSIGVGRPSLRAVVLLDQTGPARERENVVVGQGEARAIAGGTGTFFTICSRRRRRSSLNFLAAERLLQDRPEALLQRRLEDVVLVRIDRSLHDVFAQAVGGVDQHGVAKAGLGVDART